MKNKEYWKLWAKAAGIRAVKTVAQTAVGAVGHRVDADKRGWPAGSVCAGGGVSRA